MGLERFLRGALTCYSTQFRLVDIPHNFRLFKNVFTSAQTSRCVSNTVTRVECVAGRCHRVVAHGQPAARRSLCSSALQPSRDVTLFEHDRTAFFRLLTVFCGGQFLFWTYLGHFAYTGLRDTGSSTKRSPKAATTTTGLAGMWNFEMNLGSNTWRYGFTVGCLTIGMGIMGLGFLFCRRSVSQVVLHRGGKMVTVRTQSPLGAGKGKRITVPLSQVACHAHRQESPSFIPLRVKGHKFYFLLDKEGTVNNVRLFDVTVGAYRPI